MALVLFQFTAKRSLGVFGANLHILDLFFRLWLATFYLIHLLVLCSFNYLPNASWAFFSVKLPILGVFFQFSCLFSQNNLTSLEWSEYCALLDAVGGLRVVRKSTENLR